MARAGVLGYRVLPFERDGAGFRRPGDYTPLAWACAATHDLPPLAGWWNALDVREREALALTTDLETKAALAEREADKAELLAALVAGGFLASSDAEAEGMTPPLAAAIHAFVAATPSVLAVAQVEDLAGERTAINLPGTDRERPNWRRRVGAPLEDLFGLEPARAILDAMRRARPG